MPFLFKVNNEPPGPPPLTFDDDFTGNNGDPPNTDRWAVWNQNPTSTYQIYDNKLRLHVSGGGDIYLYNLYEFSGDFDVQVDWNVILGPGTANWGGHLVARLMDGDYEGWYVRVGRLRSELQRIRYAKFTPTQTYSEFTYTGTTGKFRLTRIDDFLQGYHDVGAGWVSTYPTRFFTAAGTVRIALVMTSGEFNPTATFDFDNLILN